MTTLTRIAVSLSEAPIREPAGQEGVQAPGASGPRPGEAEAEDDGDAQLPDPGGADLRQPEGEEEGSGRRGHEPLPELGCVCVLQVVVDDSLVARGGVGALAQGLEEHPDEERAERK